jgi:cyclopropane-fatty-acyl-phospholipid synthase
MPLDLLKAALELTEKGVVPDILIRQGIRSLCHQRLRQQAGTDCESEQEALTRFIEITRKSPVAPVPEKANEQHYELPPAFFEKILGRMLKYSCCFWPSGVMDLNAAEVEALRVTCERARLEDGQDILELGCGWGALTLWMAKHYPSARITAVSNSASQREFIEGKITGAGFNNVQVITADMNDFDTQDHRFDRVVSLEMFEHMRNYEELLRRISGWMKPEGLLFVHIFCHRRFAYEFQSQGSDNWMGQYFFTGGIMPSDELLLHFARDLHVVRRWRWSGVHYQRTAEAWLENLDQGRDALLPVLSDVYGGQEAERWFVRWRVFFLACSELFGFHNGQEWWISHYLLSQR